MIGRVAADQDRFAHRNRKPWDGVRPGVVAAIESHGSQYGGGRLTMRSRDIHVYVVQ